MSTLIKEHGFSADKDEDDKDEADITEYSYQSVIHQNKNEDSLEDAFKTGNMDIDEDAIDEK